MTNDIYTSILLKSLQFIRGRSIENQIILGPVIDSQMFF